ncbi:MAG: hypothetical protein JJT89_04545 [Nitriliruptoraceae bacterium]|nr:hypothetical protein [Nitriliruptoraceae bacterium]
MTKRYRERLEEVELAPGNAGVAAEDAPAAFRWRGQRYRVLSVLGHWYEDEGWWQRGDGLPERIERTDLWRVEARNGVPTRGVYELVRRGEVWRLDRVWD